jgi:hypothetical protein
MELQGIQASMATSSAMRTQSRTLTDEQKTQLEEILAKYDPENMTESDKKALVEELRSANIPPCKATFEAMEAAGFTRPTPRRARPRGNRRSRGPRLGQHFVTRTAARFRQVKFGVRILRR